MSTAYLDSSFLLSMILNQTDSSGLRIVLSQYDRVVSGDLIVAECLSVARRESFDVDAVLAVLGSVDLVHPSRSLASEIRHALNEAYLRGADLWHVACALFVATDSPSTIAFLSRDRSQRRVASHLGFETP